MGLRQAFPDARDVRLVSHYLLHDKAFVCRRTSGELDDLCRQVASLVRTIERDEQCAPRESGLYDWCKYPDFCPAKKHQRTVEALPRTRYLADPGVALVRQYAKIRRKYDDLSARAQICATELWFIEHAAVTSRRTRECRSSPAESSPCAWPDEQS